MPSVVRRESYFSLPRRGREFLPSVARIVREVFGVLAADRRKAAEMEAAAVAAAPVAPVVAGGLTYRMHFARTRLVCDVCDDPIDAGSYRPRLYVGDQHCDLCAPCARFHGSAELRRFERDVHGDKIAA